jgi:Acyl-coenzyme A:6-aminopenicillanic acid acyl-transferase
MLRHRWTRRLVYLLVMGLLLGSATLLFLVWFKPPPMDITIAGSSVDLGSGYGRSLRIPMRLVTRFYLDSIICQGDKALIQSSRAAALRSLANWPEPYRNELTAMAGATRIPVSALAFGNCFLDLGKVRAGCRSVVVAQTNLFLHAHNLDWDNLGGFGRWTTCIVRRTPTDGRFRTVSVGFPGLIGALDIINEKGLGLSFNQLGFGKGGTNEPVFIMLRRIAETSASLDAARAVILNAPPGMPFIITVSDARARVATIFERVGDRVIERPADKGWVAGCNAAQGTTFGATRLDQIMARNRVTDLDALRRVMADPEVLMGCNIYSVIFDFDHDRLWIASGEVPAAKGKYREYPLFR